MKHPDNKRPTRAHRSRLPVREAGAGIAVAVVLMIIGFISFTSSDGLPFESEYRVAVLLNNADRLRAGDNVSIGGENVGSVRDVEAVPAEPDGKALARAALSLDPSLRELPVDTVIRVRPASVLGASYVDLVPGSSAETLPDGVDLPVENAERRVQLTDLFDIFDEETAASMRGTLKELGGGLAGRGPALNASLGSLTALMGPAARVSATLAQPETRLGELVKSYSDAFSELGPVSAELAGLARGGASTFGAIESEGDALGRTIEVFPQAELAATRAFTAIRPGLDDLAALMTELQAAGPLLRPALGQAEGTLDAGTLTMRRLDGFSNELRLGLRKLDRVSQAPATPGAFRKLDELVTVSEPLIGELKEAQVTCNVLPPWASGLGGTFGGIGFGNGPAFATIGLSLSSLGATGEQFQSPAPAPDIGMNYVANNNERECESGNEPFDGSQAIGNPPGLQPTSTYVTHALPDAIAGAERAGLLDPPPWRDR